MFDGLMNYRVRSSLLDFCLFDSMDAEDFLIELQLALAESEGGELMLNLLGSHDTPRLMTLAGGAVDRVVLAFAALFTLPGTPMIFYGDEVGMEGGDDPDCRRPMQWDASKWCAPVYGAVRKLTELRASRVALRRGGFEPLAVFNRVLAFRRAAGEEDLIVVLNAGSTRLDFRVPLGNGDDARRDFVDVLGGGVYRAEDARLVIPRLAEHTALILERAA